MEEIIAPKKKMGRPRKIQPAAVEVKEIVKSEVAEFDKAIEMNEPIIITATPSKSAPKQGKREAVFICSEGHRTKGRENDVVSCRITTCGKPTRCEVIYDELQRRASAKTVRQVIKP